MEAASKRDTRNPRAKFATQEAVARPVSAEEVKESMKGMSDSAPRADRVTRGRIRAVSRLDLSVHMSFWLCGSCPPSGFREGTTTLIPKRAEATQPSEYRPITNATIIARLFHRLMARRLEDSIPLSPRQKAFRRGDGLAVRAGTGSLITCGSCGLY